jgi:hypothetical protein
MSSRRRALKAALAAAVLGSLTATPPALARGGVYGGTTAGDEAIVLRTDAKGKRLKSVVVGWTADCSDGSRWAESRAISAADLGLDRNGRGRFGGEATYAKTNGESIATFTVAVKGKLRAKRASGTLRGSVSLRQGEQTTECETSTMRWKATHAPGRVFAGSTAQEWPVVVKLDKAGRNVADMVFGWGSESCVPDGYFHYPDSVADFPIKNRRFGDAFSRSFDTGDGKATFDYDLSGKIGRASARGRFQVKVTRTDAAGTQMFSCDTGSVSWSARTG